MTDAKPEPQHAWLDQLVGEWTWACDMVEGAADEKAAAEHNGTESVRSLGGLWIVGDGVSKMPDASGAPCTTMITLGYDPVKKRFVGSFIGSMMTHLWPYEGELAADGKSLVLNSEGPSFTDPNKMAKYVDTITMETPDRRILTSRYQSEDGSWHQFMRAVYTRRK